MWLVWVVVFSYHLSFPWTANSFLSGYVIFRSWSVVTLRPIAIGVQGVRRFQPGVRFFSIGFFCVQRVFLFFTC